MLVVLLLLLLLLLVPHQTAQTPVEPSCLLLYRPRPLHPPPAAVADVVVVVVGVAAPKRHDEQKDEREQPQKHRGGHRQSYRTMSTALGCGSGDGEDILAVHVVVTTDLVVKDPKFLAVVGQEMEDQVFHCLVSANAQEALSDSASHKIIKPPCKRK